MTLLLTFLLKRTVEVDEISPGDDIQDVKALNSGQLANLIDRYQSFSDDFWYEGTGGYRHLWQDYGQVYGPIHQLVYDYLIKLK